MTIWYVVICGWKILSRVSFIWYVNTVNRVFAWVNKQSTTAPGELKNNLRAVKHTHTRGKHTNKSVMLHLYNSLGGRVDLSEQHIQFIRAIRIKISNIVPGEIPDDFQYRPPLSADMRFASFPSRRERVHSSFRNLASFMEPGASLRSHRRYEKDRHINLPVVLPDSWRNMRKERRQNRPFFLLNEPFPSFVFTYLIEFTVLQSYWACVKEDESGNEFVCMYMSVSGCFSVAGNECVSAFV